MQMKTPGGLGLDARVKASFAAARSVDEYMDLDFAAAHGEGANRLNGRQGEKLGVDDEKDRALHRTDGSSMASRRRPRAARARALDRSRIVAPAAIISALVFAPPRSRATADGPFNEIDGESQDDILHTWTAPPRKIFCIDLVRQATV
jgi:hypothetical protein